MAEFIRDAASVFQTRLAEQRRFIQVIAGPRQVGKTTMVRQVLEKTALPSLSISADEPTLRSESWLAQQWEKARLLALASPDGAGAVFTIDEVQKLPHWAEKVKRLWDEDTRRKLPLKVVLLGSAPLVLQCGLSESLAGRFETIPMSHWSWPEMRAAFGFTFEDYLFYGGYPGAAALIGDHDRWRRYILDALIETTLARDILLLSRIDKPALLRRLFELGCRYSGQILSYTKMQGQMQDAGNTTTLAHYLDLLSAVGMLTGLQKFAGAAVRSRGSSPKLLVLNTALFTAIDGRCSAEARSDGEFRGRLIESAVGAHLANAAARGLCELFWWRDGSREVDFIVRSKHGLVAIEVKSGERAPSMTSLPGMDVFCKAYQPDRVLLVGSGGIPVEDFLAMSVKDWLDG